MAGKPDQYSDEYLQSQVERQIREQCELHGWATAVSVANPVDILIMLEEDEDEYTELLALNQ
jgi:hypothetical protein